VVQFKTYSRGVVCQYECQLLSPLTLLQFDHLNEFGFCFDGDKLRALPDPREPREDIQDPDHAKMLRHPTLPLAGRYDVSAYDLANPDPYDQDPDSM
jgi:hypothetical protein